MIRPVLISLLVGAFLCEGSLLLGPTLSKKAQKAILKKHNVLRRQLATGKVYGQPMAVDMIHLKWSKELEDLAAAHAGKCVYEHSDTKSYCGIGGFDNVGENIAFATLSSDEDLNDQKLLSKKLTETAQSWWDEYKDFNYESTSCRGICSHYTQMASASTEKIGCALALCDGLSGATSRGWKTYFVVCNYGNGNNWSDRPPYKTGSKRNCPPTHFNIKNDLCRGSGKMPKRLCKDVKEHCSYWKETGGCDMCTSNTYRFMKENCIKTCGIC